MKSAGLTVVAGMMGVAMVATAALASALALMPMTAEAQTRAAPGARTHAPGARPTPGVGGTAPRIRAPAPGVRSHAPGVRSYPATHHHRSARVGVYFGAPIVAAPWWHYPDPYYHPYGPYYYPPVVVEEPAVYIEQPPPAPPPAPAPQAVPQQYWYYCESSKTYYPYVQTCATPWVRVMPHAPQ